MKTAVENLRDLFKALKLADMPIEAVQAAKGNNERLTDDEVEVISLSLIAVSRCFESDLDNTQRNEALTILTFETISYINDIIKNKEIMAVTKFADIVGEKIENESE